MKSRNLQRKHSLDRLRSAASFLVDLSKLVKGDFGDLSHPLLLFVSALILTVKKGLNLLFRTKANASSYGKFVLVDLKGLVADPPRCCF